MVAGANEYGLPGRFSCGATVIDVGAHIGAFSYACLDRGAGLVVAIEADPENARLWQHNLHRACKAADRSVLVTAGCWRSDRSGGPHWLRIERVGPNTGGAHVLGDCGQPVRALALDALVDLALALAPGRISLVKIDCEGSEWPILFTSQRLDRVDEIVGEYHQPPPTPRWEGPRTLDELAVHLAAIGFQTAFYATDPRGLGHMHAWRHSPLCQPLERSQR